MSKPNEVQKEGNYKAATDYNEAQRKFVKSGKSTRMPERSQNQRGSRRDEARRAGRSQSRQRRRSGDQTRGGRQVRVNRNCRRGNFQGALSAVARVEFTRRQLFHAGGFRANESRFDSRASPPTRYRAITGARSDRARGPVSRVSLFLECQRPTCLDVTTALCVLTLSHESHLKSRRTIAACQFELEAIALTRSAAPPQGAPRCAGDGSERSLFVIDRHRGTGKTMD